MIAVALLFALAASADAPAAVSTTNATDTSTPVTAAESGSQPAAATTPPAPRPEPSTAPEAQPASVAPPAAAEASTPRASALAEAQSPRTDDAAPVPPHLVLKIAAGAFYTQIFNVHSYGGEGFVAVGSSHNDFTVDAGLLFARGRTEHGLAVTKTRATASFEWSQGRLRLGLGPSIGFLKMDRATLTQDGLARAQPAINQLSLGGEVHGSVDLVRAESGSALFLRLSFDAEVGAWVSPALVLGYRFDAVPRSPTSP